MRRIRHNLPLGLFRCLQTIGQRIEFPGKGIVFIEAMDLNFMAVFTLAGLLHGGENSVHFLRGHHRDKYRKDHQN